MKRVLIPITPNEVQTQYKEPHPIPLLEGEENTASKCNKFECGILPSP